MLLMTITLKSTTHQIELAFDKGATCQAQRHNLMQALADHLSGTGGVYVSLLDDFGHGAEIPCADYVMLEIADTEGQARFRIDTALWKLRASRKYQDAVHQDRTIGPWVGTVDLFERGAS